jgi:hypothetical protein
MPRRSTLLALVAAATFAGAGQARMVADELAVIPYLSGGAGVFVDDDGRPVSSEGAPSTPGIHVRPAMPPSAPPAPVPPAPEPRQPVAPHPIPVDPVPVPSPGPTPIPIPSPPAEGYQRPDLVAAAALPNVSSVFCRTDAAWPGDAFLANATGYWRWGGTEITMRTWRCEGIAQEKIGTELFARGLFVLAHEASHASGFTDECDADKHALLIMGNITARLGWGWAVGDAAGHQMNEVIMRPNPPADPYCIGRIP